MSTVTVIIVTVVLLLASAFFVMIEFALLGAKRHRLEEQATTRVTARAALRGMDELTVMLAAAQLGITAVTFALGAVTKPAVSAWITPLIEAVGLPHSAAYTVSFILALLVVTFLHLVIGEMAPKSWAIAFPERAVMLIAVPARALARLLHPLLIGMNRAANQLVRWSGVEPVDRAAAGGHDTDSLRHLVEHSAQSGALNIADRDRVIGALDLTRRTLGDLPGSSVPALPAKATVGEVQDAARTSGQMRVLVGPSEFVHVRDTLTLDRSALVGGTGELVRPLLVLDPDLPVHEVLRRLREEGEQIVGVRGGAPRTVVLPEILAVVLAGPAGPAG
ncbi:CNNM domain-containing protein [Corynebacterium terpenotabidum]|uniref:CNNM transmembrane domain-containing protein n=1 Tax=Corynebacterium terpenotabidum Y-11 TaxID=1200352 RepID=S4XFQ3_9CORY|nr:CNNM domain-containing protein [Corynebacterium terpenotabidum]AGP31947.1 hypothetical protein A606_11540 [Corynebacterium terpenotabidum Y-11]